MLKSTHVPPSSLTLIAPRMSFSIRFRTICRPSPLLVPSAKPGGSPAPLSRTYTDSAPAACSSQMSIAPSSRAARPCSIALLTSSLMTSANEVAAFDGR